MRWYFLAFLIPAAVLFGVFAAFGYHPFGDMSPLVLDLNGQYIYYFEALRDAFWGDGSIFMSWSRNLNGEFMGILAYYLASPFSIIVVLLPRSMILVSVMIMQLAKIGSSGVAMFYYLKKSKGHWDGTAIIFSTLYALMSYSVVQLMDPMWLDGLIYLPLIVYGVEKLIDSGKSLRMIVPLALTFMANFYIGWMTAIFTVIYFFVYYFFMRKEDGEASSKLIKTCVRFGLGAIAAGLLAAWILLPTYFSLKLGKLEFTQPNFSLRPQFQLFDFFTKLLPESYDTVRPEGLPFVYCGVLTLIMIPLYFLNSNIERRKKGGNALILGTLLICMYLSTVDIVWHGLQVPNWIPYRYSFLFSFIMLSMAAEAFQRIEGISFKQLVLTGVAWMIYVLYVDKQDYAYLDTSIAIWFTIICLIGYLLLVNYYKNHATVRTAPLVILILVVGELFGGGLQTLKAVNKDVVYSRYSSYEPYISNGRALVEELDRYDGGFYRAEKTFHRTVNDNLAFGIRGISHSSSTLNAKAIKLLDNLGFTCGGHYIKYNGATYATDALLGIKYVITKDKDTGYNDGEAVLQRGDMKVYENPNALSLGYMVDSSIADVVLLEDDPFVNQNKIISRMLGLGYHEYFHKIELDEVKLENLETSLVSGHTRYKPIIEGQNAQLEFLFNAPTEDIIYMFFPSVYVHDREMNVWINKEYADQYFGVANYSIKTIGRFNKNQPVSVITTLTKEDAYMKDHWFYYLDEADLKGAINELKQNQWNITDYSDTYLEGTVTAKEGQILFTTVAAEPGWTVRVDGEKVEPVTLLDGVLGIPVPAGEHTVTMKFFPKGLALGIILSVAGAIGTAAIVIFQTRKNQILLKRLYY